MVDVVNCGYCGKQIGLLRRQVDREFCSQVHRQLARARSARALRDAGVVPGDEWTSLNGPDTPAKKQAAQQRGAVAALVVCGIVLMALWATNPQAGSVPTQERPDYNLQTKTSRFADWLKYRGAVQVHDDFRKGLSSWTGSGAKSAVPDWSPSRNGVLRPGRLRLWTPSLQLKNYDFEFEGQIEHKAMSWTFRSADANNYYASKINVVSPASRLEIVRYAVVGGKPGERTRLPLPIPIDKQDVYQVRVRIKKDQFVTSVNGQVVDSWSDPRLSRGGVGFFSEKGESASIFWASIASIEPTLFERLFASTFLIPYWF